MKTELESKTIYVSDDGKKKSYLMEDILKYEKIQLKEILRDEPSLLIFLHLQLYICLRKVI